MKLNKNQFLIISFVVLMFFSGLFYFILYLPLSKEIDKAGLEKNALNAEVMKTRSNLASLKGEPLRKDFLCQANIPSVLDELTRLGKTHEIRITSMVPKNLEKALPFCSVFPLEIGIEASYGKLAIFLGSLDELKQSLVVVESFNINSSENSPGILRGNLKLKVYLADIN
ncbi:MAG: type 4a pilus biogenesis protein PilO [Candidatus Omnitrophota bacterium]